MSVLQAIGSYQAAPETPATVGNYAQRYRWPLAVSGILLGVLYAPNAVKLVSDWSSDPDYSHGFIVPIVFLWLLWERRKLLAGCRLQPRSWAIGVVALGILQLYAGRLGAEYFVAHTSLLVVLGGITLCLFGWPLVRKVAFPLAWLLFMIPLPAILFYGITFPLQLIASRMASRLLDLLSVSNLRDGNVIYLPHFSMGVAEACSGIRSLITLLAFTVLVGHFLRLTLWARWVLIASAVPFALAANAARIAATGLIGNFFGPNWAEGFFHTFEGWVLFLGTTILTVGLAIVLRAIDRRGLRRACA